MTVNPKSLLRRLKTKLEFRRRGKRPLKLPVLLLSGVFAMAYFAGCASREAGETIRKSRDAGRSLRHVEITWEKALTLTFDDPEDMNRFRAAEGEWEIRDGKLRAIGGERNRAIMLAPCGQDPVRIEFEATNYASKGLIGDITVLLNSAPDKTFFSAGYALTTGSYWNNCTTFYRKGLALANTAWSPVKSGKKNRIVLEFNRGHIRYEMNGEILLETWDESPLELTDDRWIGIRTWATLMCVDNLSIYRGTASGTR